MTEYVTKRRMHLKAAESAIEKARAIAGHSPGLSKRQVDRLSFLNDVAAMHLNAADQVARIMSEIVMSEVRS